MDGETVLGGGPRRSGGGGGGEREQRGKSGAAHGGPPRARALNCRASCQTEGPPASAILPRFVGEGETDAEARAGRAPDRRGIAGGLRRASRRPAPGGGQRDQDRSEER